MKELKEVEGMSSSLENRSGSGGMAWQKYQQLDKTSLTLLIRERVFPSVCSYWRFPNRQSNEINFTPRNY